MKMGEVLLVLRAPSTAEAAEGGGVFKHSY